MKNRKGFVSVVAAIFIGLFAFFFGASAGRKAQRMDQANPTQMTLVP